MTDNRQRTATGPRTPGKKARQRAASLEQILDAAEMVFARRGHDGGTIQDVAKECEVHTSLIHYYFRNKEALFEAVYRRRADAASERRIAALERYERSAGEHPSLEGALRAFLDTDLDLYSQGGPQWRAYAAICARLGHAPEGATLVDEQRDPVVLKLIGILKRALPDLSEQDVFWGFHFVTGALLHALSNTGRLDRLSNGLCRSDDFEAIKARMANFMAAGFRALRSGDTQRIPCDQFDQRGGLT